MPERLTYREPVCQIICISVLEIERQIAQLREMPELSPTRWAVFGRLGRGEAADALKNLGHFAAAEVQRQRQRT